MRLIIWCESNLTLGIQRPWPHFHVCFAEFFLFFRCYFCCISFLWMKGSICQLFNGEFVRLRQHNTVHLATSVRGWMGNEGWLERGAAWKLGKRNRGFLLSRIHSTPITHPWNKVSLCSTIWIDVNLSFKALIFSQWHFQGFPWIRRKSR